MNPNAAGLFVNPVRSIASVNAAFMANNSSTSELFMNSSKLFVLPHPLDNDRYLTHACLEGPEAGVYIRGTGEIPAGSRKVNVVLPSYYKAFNMYTVSVRTICETDSDLERVVGASSVRNKEFTVWSNRAGPFYWCVFARRHSIEVEPYKEGKIIQGNGPYVFLEGKEHQIFV